MEKSIEKKERDSNLELFRIITMLIIIAHHYVGNSGLLPMVKDSPALSFNSLFLLLFGWGGKTGINCFVMITGFFMVKSEISLKKFLKLLLEIEFYNVVIATIFIITGYSTFSAKSYIKDILPISSVADEFNSCYLLFFLGIPFLNKLIKGLNQQQHLLLIALGLFIYTFLPLLHIPLRFNYVEWFAIVYIIAAYIRLWPNPFFNNIKFCTLALILSIGCSWVSVFWGAWRFVCTGNASWYRFVSDSNSIMAIVTAFFAFLFFKNLKIGHSKIINFISASAFGVYLIHTTSDTMRQWLWKDLLKNTDYFFSDVLIIHAVTSVFLIYVICMIMDKIRFLFFEKPFFKWFDSLSLKRLFPNN